MEKKLFVKTKTKTKTSNRTTVASSLMLASTVAAVIFSWGMIALAGLESLKNQKVRIAFDGDKGSVYLRWQFNIGMNFLSSATAGNLDNDKQSEVAATNTNGVVYALEPVDPACQQNCEMKVIWSFESRETNLSSPTIADINNDGANEVVAGLGTSIYVLRQADPACKQSCAGEKIWSYNLNSYVMSPLAVADLNNDGLKEIIVGVDDFYLYVLRQADPACLHNCQAAVVWKEPVGEIWSAPAVADMNHDGTLEVVFGDTDGNLTVLQQADPACMQNCTTRKIWSYSVSRGIQAAPAVADINNDGRLEVAIATLNDYIYVLKQADMTCKNDCQGEVQWSYYIDNNSFPGIISSPAIADIDADGQLEVVVGGGDNTVYALQQADPACQKNCQGEIQWSYQTKGDINSSPALADVDGDNIQDVIIGSDDYTLYALKQADPACLRNCSGQVIFSYSGQSEINSSPVVADIDGDGFLEIIFSEYNGYLDILTSNINTVAPFIAPWPKFHYNLSNTGYAPNLLGREFKRGDVNLSGDVGIADAITVLGFLFGKQAAPACLDAVDVNDSNTTDIADAVYLLQYLFASGSAPKQPFDTCGPDPTPDDLICESFAPCQ